jgi:hypothetical protein
MIFFGLVLGKMLLQLKKKGWIMVYVFVSFFITVNFISMALFVLRDKRIEGGGYGTEQRTIQRLNRVFKLTF